MTLFPSIQPDIAASSTTQALYKEVKWNFTDNCPVFKDGSPVVVEGKEAVLVWAWKALNTPRFRYEIYTWNFGNEIESLMGQPFTDELKRAEAFRCVRECLCINPYITDVSAITVSFESGILKISCTINTVYGEVNLHV